MAVAAATAGLLLEFRVRRGLVLGIVAVFIVADPAQFLFADFYFYALPTAALATATGWAAARWVRTERAVPGACFGVLAALLILTNSSFQVYTVVLATLPVLWVLRRRWRQAVAVLAAPLLVVVAWYSIDVVQFGSATTSSWIGMNFARATLLLDSPADINALIRQGVLSPTARIRSFSALSYYGALGRHARDRRPGPRRQERLRQRQLQQHRLHRDLAALPRRRPALDRAPPDALPANTTVGMRLWMLPADQFYATVALRDYHLGGYTTVYDSVVQLQPVADPFAVFAILQGRPGPSASNLSITVAAETLLALAVLPIVAWRGGGWTAPAPPVRCGSGWCARRCS